VAHLGQLAMEIEPSVIDALVANPAESLTVETKRWINPTLDQGIEKIVKAVLALRNRNGGHLVIGFDNSTLQPDADNQPADIGTQFHVDKIQGLVSRYSSELFEIAIAYGERGGVRYPVIAVPPGVRTPVAAKRDLVDGGKTLIRHGAVYFRTLASNGTPSSAEARPEDWREIMEICFDNREADVGRFIRRHLAGRDIGSLLSSLAQFKTTPAPTLEDRARALLKQGEERFRASVADRSLRPDEEALVEAGAWSIALAIDPPHASARADQNFIATIGASNPKYTGWPVWLDSRLSSDDKNHPKVKDKTFEALIVSILSGWSAHLDFQRLDPTGNFFLRRVLQDDAVPSKVTPGTALDPVLVIIRVAEAIAVGLTFAKALGWEPEAARLGFAFRWTKLAGRRLSRWSDPYFASLGGGTAYDDEVTTFVELSLDTPLSAIAPAVEAATADLFVAFDGAVIPSATIEEWVARLINRDLR
jgi:hypothetical protein